MKETTAPHNARLDKIVFVVYNLSCGGELYE
jgi:hypothetical protein